MLRRQLHSANCLRLGLRCARDSVPVLIFFFNEKNNFVETKPKGIIRRMSNLQNYMTPEDVAREMGYTRTRIHQFIWAKKIHAQRKGPFYLIERREFDRFKKSLISEFKEKLE